MNIYKKIANKSHDEVACATTRSTSRHGTSSVLRRAKRKANRRAARLETRMHIADFYDT